MSFGTQGARHTVLGNLRVLSKHRIAKLPFIEVLKIYTKSNNVYVCNFIEGIVQYCNMIWLRRSKIEIIFRQGSLIWFGR